MKCWHKEDVEGIFRRLGMVLGGHFPLASGLHSPVYWEKFRVIQFPEHTVHLCGIIAKHFCEQGVDVVAGPTTGGIILAFEVARQLGTRAIYAERATPRGRTFGRGQKLMPGERVLVVDDILTTGGSVRGVLDAVREAGGLAVGIGVLVDRSVSELDLGVPLFSCHRASAEAYAPDVCPQCAAGIPLEKQGSGRHLPEVN